MRAKDDPTEGKRLRFYGLNDYATFFQAERAVTVLADFDPSQAAYGINDIVELHNASLFVEYGVFPASMVQAERDRLLSLVPGIRRAEGLFFNRLTESTFAAAISGINYSYRSDVLDCLAKFKVFERCSATVVLDALKADRFRNGDLLSCKALVRAYDEEVRALLLAGVDTAELIVSKHLLSDAREIYLPASLTSADCRALLDTYVGDENANPNYLQLIATSRVGGALGIDAKLKLKARRAYDRFTTNFFATNQGMNTGVEISISDTQVEDVVCSIEGLVVKFSYSRAWLADNLDYPTILNNFIYLFEWTTWGMLLSLPSYPNELAVMERLMMSGKEEYITGVAFRMKDQSSLLQTHMYRQFLLSQGVDIEAVIAWFFTDYLRDEFGAENLRFTPSSQSSTYLEKCRHLFSEMESVLKQFTLYAENGELDWDLLSMTSEQLSYECIPSTVPGKYVYVTDHRDIRRIQHLLFSDQSHLCYIDDELKADSLAKLLLSNHVTYDTFDDHQRSGIDLLLSHGVLINDDSQIKLASAAQYLALKELWENDAGNYWHHSPEGRAAIDRMAADGWLERRSTLLTTSEAEYINYFLNQSGPAGGPDLRNRYLHGSQADGDDNAAHLQTYLIALRLLIATVIKLNDELCLRTEAESMTCTA
ncbi:hypothetical protein BAY59_27715 [Prauserella coralliicola]|nr:hypothetical protein BAY59_27715 [Prauserella coralliicola]